MSNIQELREAKKIVYTDTEMNHGPVHDTEGVKKTMGKKLLL